MIHNIHINDYIVIDTCTKNEGIEYFWIDLYENWKLWLAKLLNVCCLCVIYSWDAEITKTSQYGIFTMQEMKVFC